MDDEITSLNKRLKEIVDKFKELKDCGMDEEILIIYLQEKTKLSKKKVKEILFHTEEFYEKLVKKNVIKSLKN
jgi:hypothetical protein